MHQPTAPALVPRERTGGLVRDPWSHVQGWVTICSVRSEDTGRTYLASANRAVSLVMQHGGVEGITPERAALIYQALCELHARATANLTVRALSSFWNYLISTQGLPLENPWKTLKVRRPKLTVAQRVLSLQEMEALIKAANPGFERIYIRFLYYTGARVTESVTVEWADISPGPTEGHYITIQGKRGKTRTVLLRESLYRDLQTLKGEHKGRIFKMTRQGAWKLVKRVAARARIRDSHDEEFELPDGSVQTKHVGPVSTHWTRHTHATHALDAGANIRRVQEDMGHASLETTQIYTHPAPGEGSGDILPEL